MKNFRLLLIICVVLIACNKKTENGRFTLDGEIKNVPDQLIYLEQLYLSQKNPDILDTAAVKGGRFSLTATAPEEGLYRIRLEKNQGGFIFINDAKEITFKADMNDTNLDGPVFNTRANGLLKQFLLNLSAISTEIENETAKLEALKTTKNNDSAVDAQFTQVTDARNRYKNFIIKYIDTCSDPVVSMFALGYTQGIDPKELKTVVPSMAKRFPEHNGVIELVTQFNTLITQSNQQQQPQQNTASPSIGDMAPDFTMADPEGNPFSLSQLRGKYVLVDFWASWCGPCRRENPNLVAAYNKYNKKNFTILGVSLDQDKAAWVNAIKKDGLLWKQISDLKYWNSASVGLYGFDGIPYNVLLDPQGKIIATSLREAGLDAKLAEVLK